MTIAARYLSSVCPGDLPVLQLLRRWTAFMAWIAAATAAFVGLLIAASPLNETLIYYQRFGVVWASRCT
jgi:hypothetical protein